MDKRSKSLLLALASFVGALACTWTKKDEDDWVAGLVAGCIVGALFALIAIVIAALPLCCGIMKPQGKIIAGVCMFIGIFMCFVPAIAAKASGDSAITKFCDRCAAEPGHGECTEKDKQQAKDGVAALGIIVAYLLAYGWVTVILGITAAALSCCICCKCCKMADEPGAQAGAPPAVVGQVVGQVA